MFDKLIQSFLGSLIRHFLSYAAGFLLALGLSPRIVESWQGSTEELLASIGTLGIALVLSRVNRQKNE